MAKIFISYYRIQEVPLNKINCMWDGLFQELSNTGNDVFIINTAFFNVYNSNQVKNKDLDSYILSKVKEFAPELIITFNHRIPQCILDNFKDIPTIIWDGDELSYFCDLTYIKKNLDRYRLFSIVRDWKSDYLNFGFNDKQISYMPIATSIKAKDIPKDKNISFLGGVHYNSGRLNKVIDSCLYESGLSAILYEHLNNPTYDYEELFKKHLNEDYSKLKLVEKDLYPLFDYRLITLINLLDLGLQINGYRWELVTKIVPQLSSVHNSELIWTSKENEDYFNSSKISINPIHPQARGSGFSWRVFDIMASNACLVCENSLDLKELVKNYVDVPMYKTPWEAREICKQLLVDSKKRREISLSSQKFINEKARWIHRFKDMEHLLNIKLINAKNKGSLYYLKDDENFQKYTKVQNKKMCFRDKIKYKIWKHYNKILKSKGLI